LAICNTRIGADQGRDTEQALPKRAAPRLVSNRRKEPLRRRKASDLRTSASARFAASRLRMPSQFAPLQTRLFGPGSSDQSSPSSSQTSRTTFGSRCWRDPTWGSCAVRPSRWIVTLAWPCPRCSRWWSKRHPRSASQFRKVALSIDPLPSLPGLFWVCNLRHDSAQKPSQKIGSSDYAFFLSPYQD
jgi:hypothetical protein